MKKLHVLSRVSDGVVVRIVSWWRISNLVWGIVRLGVSHVRTRAIVTMKLVPPPSTAAMRACFVGFNFGIVWYLVLYLIYD